MNPKFKRKLPMIIFFCILLGLVIYLLSSQSQFSAPLLSSSWSTSTTNSKDYFGQYYKFIFPDPATPVGWDEVTNSYGFVVNQSSSTLNHDWTKFTITSFGPYTIPNASSSTSFILEGGPQSNNMYYNSYFGTNFGGVDNIVRSYQINGKELASEYGLLNFIMQNDMRIAAFMNNDQPLLPLVLSNRTTSSGAFYANPIICGSNKQYLLRDILFYYIWNKPDLSFRYVDDASTSTTTYYAPISINEALLIPAKAGVKGSNNTNTAPNNNTKVRLQIILGVLTHMHILLNNTPNKLPLFSSFNGKSFSDDTSLKNATSSVSSSSFPLSSSNLNISGECNYFYNADSFSIMQDLRTVYNISYGSSVEGTNTPPFWGGKPIDVFGRNTQWDGAYSVPTPNVARAINILLMARDAWINKMITNLDYL